jgi:hypothetical protein
MVQIQVTLCPSSDFAAAVAEWTVVDDVLRRPKDDCLSITNCRETT